MLEAAKTPEERRKLVWVVYVGFMAMWAFMSYQSLVAWRDEHTLFAKADEQKHVYVSDFVNHYNAGQMARACLEGEHIDVYDINVQDERARKLIAPLVPEKPFYFQLPPTAFVVFAPLSLFGSMERAWAFWALFWMSVCSTCMYFLTRGFPMRVRIATMVLTLSCFPMWLSVEVGQASFLVFMCVSAMYLCLCKRMNFLAGLFCSLISVKVQYLPIFGLIGLILGGWKFFLGCITGGGALLAASIGIIGWDNVAAWPRALVNGESSEAVSGVSAHMMQNLRAVFALAMRADNRIVHGITVALYLIGSGAIGWMVWKNRDAIESDSARRDAMFALAIVGALITSIHAHIQDFILACIACWLAYRMVANNAPLNEARSGRMLRATACSFALVSWVCFFLQPLGIMLRTPPFLVWSLWFIWWILQARVLRWTGQSVRHSSDI